MARKPRQALNDRERQFVTGIAQGKTKTQAARDAGYAESTALKQSYQFLSRPLVQTALTVALERLGVTFDKILQPVIDGLEATIILKNMQTLTAKKTALPDLTTRLQAHDRAVALLAGVPSHVKPLPPLSRGLVVHFHEIPSGLDSKPAIVNRPDPVSHPQLKKRVRVEFSSIPAGPLPAKPRA